MKQKPFALRDVLPKGDRDLARQFMDAMLICAVKRNGGKMSFSIEEVDAANDLLTMDFTDNVFTLIVEARN